MQGNTYQVDKGPILEIPIFKPLDDTQNLISTIIDIIICFKKNNKNPLSSNLEEIVDALIFNLYFSDHMQEKEIDVLPFVEKDIEAVMQGREFETLNDLEKQVVIDKLHKIWIDPENEVVKRMGMFKEKSPDILGVIMDS
jgi:hypothetical protein